MKPVLCLDFDGVIHSYTSGWHGHDRVTDPPVPGAIAWIAEAVNHWTVCVFSSRSEKPEGIVAMRAYVWEHLNDRYGKERGAEIIGMIKFPASKPASFLSIDDRAITFQGSWGALNPKKLLEFKPWNKRGKRAGLHEIIEHEGVVYLDLSVPTTQLSWTREEAKRFANSIIEAAGGGYS